MSKLLEEFEDANGRHGFLMWCPGCKTNHSVIVSGEEPVWMWNGSHDATTFSPSIRVRWTFGEAREPKVCHSFIRLGQWEYLGDCTHALAGKTVPMVAFYPDEEQQT